MLWISVDYLFVYLVFGSSVESVECCCNWQLLVGNEIRSQDLKCCSLLSKPVRIGIIIVVVIIVIGIVGFRQPPQKSHSNQQKMKKLQMWCKINDSPAKAVSVGLQKGRCQFLRFLDKAISSASFLDMFQIPATGTTHLYSDIPYVSLSISCCAIGSFSSWW